MSDFANVRHGVRKTTHQGTFVVDGALMGLNLGSAPEPGADCQLCKMNVEHEVELRNVGGCALLLHQNGDFVDLYIGDDLMAIFTGAQGLLNARDVQSVTRVVGYEPDALDVGTPPAFPPGRTKVC